VPRTTGTPPDAFRLIAEPREVSLVVPSDMPRPPEHVWTEPIDLSGVEAGKPTTLKSRLRLPDGARLAPNQGADVKVRVITAGKAGPQPKGG
jgi:hypothetical protein